MISTTSIPLRCSPRGYWPRLVAGMMLAVVTVALVAIPMAPVSAQPPAPPAAGPGNLRHVIDLEHSLGALLPRGFLATRITITRQGPAAAAQRDTSYWVVSEQRDYYYGLRMMTDARELTLSRGSTSVTANVVLRQNGSYNSGLFCESDGNLSYQQGPGDHARFSNTLYTGGNNGTDNVQCLFVGDQPLDTISTTSLTENTRQRGFNQAQGPYVPSVVPDRSVATEVPAVWYLNEVLGQTNVEVYQRWAVATPAAVPPPSPTTIDETAHRDIFENQQFIGWTRPDSLPSEWQGLIPVDYLFLSQATLQSMTTSQPEQFEALRNWVIAGGRLVISDCGSQLRGLRAIEPALFRPAPGEQRSPWQAMKWSDVATAVSGRERDLMGSPAEGPQYDSNGSPIPVPSYGRFGVPDDADEPALTTHGHPVMRQRDLLASLEVEGRRFDPGEELVEGETVYANLGAGRVIAAADNGAGWNTLRWKQVLVTAMCGAPGPLMIDSFSQATSFSFPAMAMPGLGRPPWLAFTTLIILFVIGVGPVAFAMLERRRRLPWMLAIVPGVASICTLGLLVYALVSEGLGSRSTRLSLTRLDQRNHVAITRTQLVGYSGLAPGGLRFAAGEVLFPDESPRYDLTTVSDPEGHLIRGGAIRPRTVHQLQIARPHASAQELRVSPPASGSREWTVINRLGADCETLIVGTSDGYLFVDRLESGASVSVTEMTGSELAVRIARESASPTSSLGQAQALVRQLVQHDRYDRAWRNDGTQVYISGPDFSDDGDLDDSQLVLSLFRSLFGQVETGQALSAGSYLALTSSNEHAARFPHAARNMGELHLIHGRW